MKDILLSIVTPTYNRAHLLGKCFESLKCQTDNSFEWIIVDDGSTDNTDEVVETFQKENVDFSISFVKKENGGKHTALNASHQYIHGKYVLILDSDDYLTNEAVEIARCEWAAYEQSYEIGIVAFLKGESSDKPNCIAYKERVVVDILKYKRKIVYSADCCEVIRAELFKKYPFPVFKGERFVSECALWNRVAKTHKCIYINQVIYICEYLQGGLTESGKPMRIRNPHGGMFTSNLRMGRNNFFSQRIKYGLLYTCYGFFAKMPPVQMACQCDSKILVWLCMPFGWVLYVLWKKKYYR